MNIELTAGEQRMLEHARQQAKNASVELIAVKGTVSTEELQRSKRNLGQALASVEYLIKAHSEESHAKAQRRKEV